MAASNKYFKENLNQWGGRSAPIWLNKQLLRMKKMKVSLEANSFEKNLLELNPSPAGSTNNQCKPYHLTLLNALNALQLQKYWT